MQHRRIGALLAAGLASAVLATPAFGQTTGGITGQVVDANTQLPVADAVVIATSPALQGEQTAVTDATGSFEISLLPSGVYSLTIQREGFQPFTQPGLQVRLDRTLKLKTNIFPEAVTGQEVVIQYSRPVIENNVTTGASVSKEQMNLVPYGRNARNFEAVTASVPGVHADLFGISMNGSGSPENNYVIDGVQVNDPAVGTQGTTLLQDFVQEVDVKTGGYQAEYGRATGGVINVVTKSGGNDFHGSVFVNWSPYEAQRNLLGQRGLAIAQQVKQNYNLDFGAELGGPILRDKLWFFAGFAPQITSVNYDRIIQSRIDDGTGQPVIDPATGAPKTTEVARKTYPTTTTSYQFTGKLTYLISENHNLALAIYGNPNTTTGAAGFLPATAATGNSNEGVYIFDSQGGSTDVSLRYAGKLLNKTMLVEATGAYHHQFGGGRFPNVNFVNVGSLSGAQLRDLPAISWRQNHNLLDPVFDDGTVPDYQKSAAVQQACALKTNGFDPCPVLNYGTGGQGFEAGATLDRIGGVLKLSNFVELAGHHQFKYGIDGAQDYYNIDKFYTGGQFFRALSTGGLVNQFFGLRGFGHADPAAPGLPQFDTARPGHLAGDEISTKTRNLSVAFFAQDTWSILDKVVLDLGIRAEKQMMYPDKATLDANGNPVQGAGIDLTNVMPRVGLIYDFTGRGLSKVYASFGRFYEYIPLDLADRALSAETQVTYTTNPQNCVDPKDPRTCAIIPGGQGNGRTYLFTGGAAGTSVDPKLQGQYADEYQAGIQYQVYRDIAVGVEYTRKQLGRVVEDMSVDDGNTYFLSNPGEQGKLGYQGVTATGLAIPEPPPKRVYDGITLSVNKSFSDNYLLSASYTYSSFRGNYPGLFRNENGQLDPNILSEYDLLSLLPNKDGPLPGDIPNSFKLDGAYVYELDAKTSLNFGANLTADQGQPINYLGAHPLYGNSEAFILPRGAGGRLPWQWGINLRAAAAYKITKDYNLSVSVDLFNVTNNQATTAVDQNYTFDSVSPIVNGSVKDLSYLKNTAGAPVTLNPTFLQPTAYQLPFSARLGAKLSF